MRSATWFALATLPLVGLLATGGVADEGDPGKRVAAVIDRLRKDLDQTLKRAAKASREGRTGEALELVERAVAAARAGRHAAYNTAGRSVPADSGPAEAEPAPQPTAYRLIEKYDRFTGEARVRVEDAAVRATHMDTGEPAEIRVRYVTWSAEGIPPRSVFFFGTSDAELYVAPRPAHVDTWMLVDGKRSRHALRPSAEPMDGSPLQQVAWDVPGGELDPFLAAGKAELRIGVYELEISPAYRAAATRARAALAKLVK